MYGEEIRFIARVNYKPLHRGKSETCNRMSSIDEDPKSNAVKGDMSSLDGALGGLCDMRDSLHSKPSSTEQGSKLHSSARIYQCLRLQGK